jgi:hypothetical protein
MSDVGQKLALLDISRLVESRIQTISFLKMVESKEVTTLRELGAADNFKTVQHRIIVLTNLEIQVVGCWMSDVGQKLALLDISRLVESRIQTIRFFKNGRKYRGHNFGGARGQPTFKSVQHRIIVLTNLEIQDV